jgi:nitroreductase
MSPDQCPPLRPEWRLDPEQVEHFFRSPLSIRVYKPEPVPKETLAKLIDLATYAPSGHNRQPVRWRVVYDAAELKRLTGIVVDWIRYMIQEQPAIAIPMHFDRVVEKWEAGTDGICRDAPHSILAHGEAADPTVPSSCTIALSYLELAARSLGLGACWAGFVNIAATNWPPMQQALNLPEGHGAFGAMMVGVPRFRYQRLPKRNAAQVAWA